MGGNCHVRCAAWKDSGKKWTGFSLGLGRVRAGRGGLRCERHVAGTKQGTRRRIKHDATVYDAILTASRAYRANLKASQITEERKTWATYTDVSLFGLRRTRCAKS